MIKDTVHSMLAHSDSMKVEDDDEYMKYSENYELFSMLYEPPAIQRKAYPANSHDDSPPWRYQIIIIITLLCL